MERMRLTVNGESVEAVVEPQELLLDFLRPTAPWLLTPDS